MKHHHTHLGKQIYITPGSARGLAPGSFAVCAIGGGAEGWAVVHIGPMGDAADLGCDYHFASVEEALEFAKDLIELMQAC